MAAKPRLMGNGSTGLQDSPRRWGDSMVEKPGYFIFDTVMGWVGILGSAEGLKRLTLPKRSEPEALQFLGLPPDYAVWAPRLFDDLVERLRFYLSGHKVDFLDELDLSANTAFQCRVWDSTRLIPFGETRSYSWVAEQTGQPRAARAAGSALARNPLPIIIPCHRVVSCRGGLGGFAGGIEMKQHLLSLEASASAD